MNTLLLKKNFLLYPEYIYRIMSGPQFNCRPNIKASLTKWDLAPFMEPIHVLVYVIGSQSPFC
jgi:hypothetical protein